MGTVAVDEVELEVMRKEDSSWHPCQVSLSSDTSTGFSLIVDLGGQDLKDIIFSKEEALERLRIRSTPLQGDECFHIKEGEHVLASQETQFRILFFDAEVEKVCRIRHSKRNPCRCTFEIKWLHLPRKGAVTVPASSIMKLAIKTVDSHPTVDEFLNSVKTFNCSGLSSFVSILDETVFETALLEKQIEEISRLADGSRKGFSEDCLLELKRDLTEQAQHRTIASQQSFLQDQASHDQNNSKRTTRSQGKTKMETEKIPPPPQSISEEPNRPYLSPLGARAALASLMYKLPPEPEFSAYNVEQEDILNAFQSTPEKHTNMVSLDVTRTFMDSDVCIQKKASIKDAILSTVEASLAPVILTRTKITNLTCSESDSNLKNSMKPTRLTRLAIQKGTAHSNDEVELKPSFKDVKLRSPTHTPRFTRSTMQRETRNVTADVNKGLEESKLAQNTCSDSHAEVELKTSYEEMKLHSPSQTPRFTRSAIQKETRNATVEVNNGLEEIKNAHDTGSDSNAAVELKYSNEMKLCSPTHTSRFTRSAIQREARNVTVEVNKGLEESKLAHDTCSDSNAEVELKYTNEMKLRSPTQTPRFTRSAIQKEARNMTLEVNKGLGESKVAHNTGSDSTEDRFTPQTKETRKKRPVSSPSDAQTNSSLAQGKGKKLRASEDNRITRGTEGEISEDRVCLQGEKKSGSSKMKPNLRFSPRLRFLPRTRSHNK